MPPKAQQITQVFSSSQSLLLLCEIGVYYIGYDLLSSTFTYTPQLVTGLEQVKFVQASVTSTYAAGIDDLGNLYMWGGIFGLPHLVESGKVFTSSKVLCNESVTCICTWGGYVYLYGDFKNDLEIGEMNSISELSKHFVVDVCVGKNFCGVLSEEGAVFCFDQRKELIRMPGTQVVLKIFSVDVGVIGIDQGFLYKWHGGDLKTWQLEVFRLDGPGKVLNCLGMEIVVQGPCTLELLKTIENYKISTETQALFMASPKAMTSPHKPNLYPSFFPPDNSFNKLLNYRKQHKQAEILIKIIKPLILPSLTQAWTSFLSYIETKAVMNRTVLYTLLPTVLERSINKVFYINSAFALGKITAFSKAKSQKQAEIIKILKIQRKLRNDHFALLIRKLLTKQRFKVGQGLIDKIKVFMQKTQKKSLEIKKIFYLTNKSERFFIAQCFTRWAYSCAVIRNFEEGLRKICRIGFVKLTFFALQGVKMYQFTRESDLNRRKSALKIVLKRIYVKELLRVFTKWTHLRFVSKAKKVLSKKIYISLAKNIYAVVSHKVKKNVKWSFGKLLTAYLHKKLANTYRQPLLYFTTVASKILCRLKFSAFTAVQRTRNKGNTTINLSFSDKLHSFWYIIEKVYLIKLRDFLDVIHKEINITSLSLHSIAKKYPEQTMTFSNEVSTVIYNREVPKLSLHDLKSPKKPPTSKRTNLKALQKTPNKPPNRSGSFSGNISRDDSLTRRINYDSQLRKKQKNNVKYSQKNETYKESMSLIKGKPKSQKKILEIRPKPLSSLSDRENPQLLTFSLGIFALKRFFDRQFFTTTRISFKIMKKFYKYTRPSRCLKNSPEKLFIHDYHFS